MIQQERMIKQFIEMAEISSPSFNERAMADYVINVFNELGYQVIEDDAGSKIGGNTGNLIIDVPGTINKTILLSAHLDTVVPCDNVHVIRENGKIFTDKTTVLGGDDKLGIAMILEIVKQFKELAEKPHLRIIISVCEEKGLKGASALDPKYLANVDFAFVLDGGDDVGVVTTKTPYRIAGELIVTGKEAHAGIEPEKGINALMVAANALVNVKVGRIDEETTSNIGIVSGGLAQNIVMKELRITYETRSIQLAKIKEQAELIIAAFTKACEEAGATFTHTLTQVTTGYEIAETSPSVLYVKQACEKLGMPFKTEASGGASDANVFNMHNVETLVYSVGMREVHTVNEYVYEEDFIKAAELLFETLKLIK